MTGLYIHIPFCESICPYCDFSTWKANTRHHNRWLETVQMEMEYRCRSNSEIETIYFGGGTPSELEHLSLIKLFEDLKTRFDLSKTNEITFEANPNSFNRDLISILKSYGVNRISLGVQSFDNNILKALGRTHDSKQSENCIELALASEFDVSIDLMFGVPIQTTELLEKDLKKAVNFDIHHLSLYGLTIEPNTLFHQKKSKKMLPPIDEENYDTMYISAFKILRDNGYNLYEISNFCKTGKESQHNSNYWNHSNYMGIGPGAHSLINGKRMGNSKKFAQYEKWVQDGCIYSQIATEVLSRDQLYSESIWLGLRTSKGINLDKIQEKFKNRPSQKKLDYWSKINMMKSEDSINYTLTGKGWLYVDEIAGDLV